MLTPLIAGEPTTVEVLERTTPRYRAVLEDNEGNPIPAASLTTFTLTLYVIKIDGTLELIRNDQNIPNANNVTVDTNGVVIWSMQVADLALVEAVPFERHVALFEWTWSAGAKAGKHEVVFSVKNLTAVP